MVVLLRSTEKKEIKIRILEMGKEGMKRIILGLEGFPTGNEWDHFGMGKEGIKRIFRAGEKGKKGIFRDGGSKQRANFGDGKRGN